MSRYAVLSDIHGNIRALEAVLAHAAARGLDRFLDLGDSVYGPLEPLAPVDRERLAARPRTAPIPPRDGGLPRRGGVP